MSLQNQDFSVNLSTRKSVEFYANPDQVQNLEMLAEGMLAVLGNFEWDSEKLEGTLTLLAYHKDQQASDEAMLETILKDNGFLIKNNDQ